MASHYLCKNIKGGLFGVSNTDVSKQWYQDRKNKLQKEYDSVPEQHHKRRTGLLEQLKAIENILKDM